MSWFRRSADEQRERAARLGVDGALATYLARAFPSPESPVDGVEFLAVDVETTGLDPGRDHVVAVGWVPVIGRRVVLAQARTLVVAAPAGVGHSATIHGLTDDVVASGVPWSAAVDELLEALAGRVLLAHFARIETGFLRRACDERWGVSLPMQVVDTMELQRRLVATGFGSDPAPGALRLWTARHRYGLPDYKAHDPLVDALSCAELMLAQTAELGAGTDLSLRRILT